MPAPAVRSRAAAAAVRVAIVACATLALWALGDPRVVWAPAGADPFAPFDAPVTVEARDAHASDARRVVLPSELGGATHVALRATVAFEPATATTPWGRPAFVRVRFVDLQAAGAETVLGRPAFASTRPRAAPTAVRGVGALPAGTDALDVQLVALRGTGAVRYERVGVELVHRRGGYLAAAAALGALWLALGVALARACLARAGAPALAAGAAALGIIVGGVSLSESVSVPGLAWLRAAGADALPALSDASGFALFKAGHFLAFALAGAVAAGVRVALGATRTETIALLALVACASEALQRHLPDRSARLSDVGIDLAGALLGFALTAAALGALRALVRRRRAGSSRAAPRTPPQAPSPAALARPADRP